MGKITAFSPWGKKAKRRTLMGLLLALAMLCSVLSPFIPAQSVVKAAEGAAQLSNLIIDKVYEFTPVGQIPDGVETNDIGFAPEIMEYNGTAYRSVDEIQIYPFAESDTAAVTVNGEPLNENGYVSMNVANKGTHDIKVSVTDGGSTSTYTVHVEKVDTDYRGRRPIAENETIMNAMTVQSDFGDTEKLTEILKKDYEVTLPATSQVNTYVDTKESYWTVSKDNLPNAEPGTTLPNDNDGEHGVFTIDLGDVYSVSRIRAVFGPSNLNLARNRARISVSTDGKNWETPITKGNLNTGTQFHQNVTRYEFGVSYDARYIRFDVVNYQQDEQNPANIKDLRIYQFMVFYDAGETPERQPAPEGGSVAHQHEDRHQYLASGQATVVERGLTISGWTPSSGYGRGIPTAAESEKFGYDGPLFYDPDFENPDYMLYNPDALWGIAKAPFGGNTMASAGEPRDFIPASMKPYIGNAISFCFGDEGGYSSAEAQAYGKWFDWTRQHYPGVILHTNQFPNQWNKNSMIEYLRVAQPDMLCWDDYYGAGGYANPSSFDLSNPQQQKNAVRRLLKLPTWETYRELAYGGVDGTGAKPIMFGQYLDAFAFNKSESNKNLIVNTSLLSGAKWLNFFRMEYQFDRAYLFDEDGTPTRGFLEWGEIIDRVHAVDDQLTRLNNDWVMFKVGEMGNTNDANVSTDGFRMSNFDAPESAEKNKEFGIAGLDVTSLSEAHDGLTGDVALGYFNTLPGLYETEIKEYFEGATAPKAFMLMNGLVAGKDEKYNVFNIPEREAGSEINTQQQITVTVDPEFAAANTLYLVDKDDVDENGSAVIKPVTLNNNSFTVTLGGGEANLYFWNTNSSAEASSAGEGKDAAFAFDVSKETYWQPAGESADHTYTVQNMFDTVSLEKVTILEKGDAVESYRVEYMDENGTWKLLGEGTTIGAVKDVAAASPVNAKGIRVTVTSSSGLPALYSVDLTVHDADSEQAEKTVTVNDNTMGDGLFRFNYDKLWSYRETESNGSAMSGSYPLENDGHFSNWADAEATFKFYGTGVELLLRGDQAANIKAAVFREDGTTVVQDWKTGTKGQKILAFNDLSENNEVYVLKIQKVNVNQAGIDGANVKYKGTVGDALITANSQGSKAVQEYVDQRTTDNQGENYFTYGTEVVSKEMGTNNSGFGVDADEDSKWVEHVQNAQYQNLGFTRTKADNASYTLNFYGTGVTLYGGVTPMGDAAADKVYGDLTFTLDGTDVTDSVIKLETANLGTNGKISAGMWQVDVPDAQENAEHTLEVTVTGGYSRIDYAVVNKFFKEGDTSFNSYPVSASAGENGQISLVTGDKIPAGGNIVAQITPNEGYQIGQILVNNVSVPIPADGRLVVTNVQSDTSISVTFTASMYDIQVSPDMAGGTLAPNAFSAAEGTVVTLTPEAFSGYQLAADSVSVLAADGAPVEVSGADEGYTFAMPSQSVVVSAAFESTAPPAVNKDTLSAAIQNAEALNSADYTQESYQKVADALAAARQVMNDPNASQQAVDAASEALNQAIGQLVPVASGGGAGGSGGSGGSGSTGGSGGSGSAGGTGGTGGSGGSGGSGSAGGSDANKAVSTGDSASAGLAIIVLLISLLAAALAFKKLRG